MLSEDPVCQEPVTQWLMHANLTSVTGADMWHYVYRELLPANGNSISPSFLQSSMAARYGSGTRYAVITTCYTKGLQALHYIDVSNQAITVVPQAVHKEYLYLYAYDLLREWEAIELLFRELSDDEKRICIGKLNALL